MRANPATRKRLPHFSRWPRSHPRRPPTRGAAHLWFIPLDQAVDTHSLDHDERQRAARLHPMARQRFACGRVALRAILAHYTQAEPAALRFHYNANGKPMLSRPAPAFNLAHSGDFGLLAIAVEEPLGVDLEIVRPRARIDALARRVLDADTQKALQALGGEHRLRHFLHAWTLLEATIKAHGDGLFKRTHSPQPRLARISLEIGAVAIGALATAEGRPPALHCFQWRC